jgi:hypothetical protein
MVNTDKTDNSYRLCHAFSRREVRSIAGVTHQARLVYLRVSRLRRRIRRLTNLSS